MRLSKQPRPSVLPKHFPSGTVYVVEGRGGEDGRLQVSSRYLILPGEGRIDLLSRSARAQLDRGQSGRIHGRGSLRAPVANQSRTAGTGTKKSARAAKKFVVVAGTAA